MFYQIFLAMFLALACPKHSHKPTSPSTSTTVTTQDDDGGGGGEEGHIPPATTISGPNGHC